MICKLTLFLNNRIKPSKNLQLEFNLMEDLANLFQGKKKKKVKTHKSFRREWRKWSLEITTIATT